MFSETEPAVADGFWLMLAPLSAGEHVVNVRGGPARGFPDGFETEVIYTLTVER